VYGNYIVINLALAIAHTFSSEARRALRFGSRKRNQNCGQSDLPGVCKFRSDFSDRDGTFHSVVALWFVLPMK
jgi:hypothetical protein